MSDERNVQEIVGHTGLGQPNVSNHLRCLLECGLVSRRKVAASFGIVWRTGGSPISSVMQISYFASTANGVDACQSYTD